MGLVSKNIPNLINGISQQPPALRLPTQGEVQENGLSDIVDGLKKRPPTKFLKKLVKCKSNWVVSAAGSSSTLAQGNLTSANTETLSEADLASAVVQTYKRSGEEQYTVVILPHASVPTILVYDILGNLRYQSGKSSWLADGTTITYTTSSFATGSEVVTTHYGNSDDTSYLVGEGSTVLSNNDVTTTSVADATFIVNKKKVVQLDNTLIQPDKSGYKALIYLKSVNYGREYKLTINPKDAESTLSAITASDTTPNANADQTNQDKLQVSEVIGDLRSDIVGNSNAGVFNVGGQFTQGSRGTTVYYDGSWYDPFGVQSNNYIENDVQEMMTYQLTTGAFNSDSTKMMVIVGGEVIPYSSSINSGWRYLDVANRKILLPKFVGDYEYVSATSHGYNYDDDDDEYICSVPQAEFRNTTNGVATIATTLSPATYTNEPYFVLTSPENGTLKDFSVIATDDDGGTNLRVFKDTAKSFIDLPNQCIDGFRIAVVGDNNKNEDNFHVVFVGDAGQGVWKETVAAGLQNYYDLTTMPHCIKQRSDLRFEFTQGDWDHRKAGDTNTNPAPSFVGRTISDIFFHRNRLGLLSGENVIFSEAGSYYNFYRTTVRTLLDADPIDVAVSQNEVSELKAALPIQDALLLFSELNQFTLTSSQLLTPADVTVDQSTKFECDLTATPVSAGNSAFFATKGGNYAGVREYYTEGDTEIKDATLVTSHVPEYLKGVMRKMVASTNENMLVCLTTDNLKEAYIYKWYNQANQRVQSAWSKWIFDTDVVDISFNNSNLYITFGDGRFETMAVRTDAPDVSFGNSVSFPAEHGVSTYSAGTPFIDTTVTPNVLKSAVSFTALARVNGNLAGLTVTSGGTSPFASISINTPLATGNIQSLEVNGRTFNITDSEYVAGTTSQYGVDWKLYQWDLPLNSTNVAYLVGLVGKEPIFNVGMISGVNFAGKKHDVLLDHKVRLTHTTDTPITSISELDAAYPDMDANTKFINFRGEIVATGNTTTAKNLVISHLYNAGTSAAFTHVENDATVSNYVDVGQPYTFKYGLSEQVFEPAQGDTTSLARFQLRNMTFNFNSTGTFDVTNETVGRLPATSNFTGRLLGQTANIIGYAAVVDTGNHTINIQSQASNAKITITNDTHLPSTFQSAEWEGYVVLRNQRL